MMTSTLPAAVLLIAAVTGQPRGEVLDFSASWCGPCQRMAPIVSRLEDAGYPIRKVDVASNRALAERFGISSIPAFVLVVDGKEVTRLVGAIDEQQLLSLFSQIPSDPPVMTSGSESRPRSRAAEPAATWPTSIGNAAPASRAPSRDLTQPVAVVADEAMQDRAPPVTSSWKGDDSPGLFGKLFGRGKQQPAPQTPDVVRANIDNATAPANVLPVRNPAGASLRLHVTINDQTHMGSGTAIDSRAGQTLVLTCGHLFECWNERSKIEVDLFVGSETQRFVGRMIHYDAVADVGIIGIPTDEIVATAEVAPAASRPQIGEPLVSIGCSGGAPPSQEQIEVTALNYYEGPDNILCTGIPVQGRSGGGLFNRQGQLVGVCIAADAERGRGAYAGLLAIHDLLTAAGLSDLYQSAPTAQPSTEFADVPPVTPSKGGTSPTSLPPTSAAPPTQTSPPVAAASQPPENTAAASTTRTDFDPFASPENSTANDMEVVCIIRSRTKPEAPSRVVIIDRPSPRFLSYLDGEIAARETPVRTNHVPPTSTTPSPAPTSTRFPESSTRFSDPAHNNATPAPAVVPGEHSRTASLQPTALTQPFRPHRYVRSAHTRDER